MLSSGCLPAVAGQAAQSVLRCSLINLLMRLYPLAAREGKKETFVIPAVLRTLVFLLSLAAFLNWLLLILYHLDTTTLTTIPSDGNSFWTCNRTLWKPRGLKASCREKKYYLPHCTGAATRTGGICFHTTGNHFSALGYVSPT